MLKEKEGKKTPNKTVHIMWHFNVSTFSILLLSSLYNGACHLNAEFQRIGTRDKKAFFRVQCKKVEENNNMGKTRDLFKKIRDTKGTLQVKMHAIKTRNDMDLAAAEDIKKRCQEYTEKLCRNVLMTQITMMM